MKSFIGKTVRVKAGITDKDTGTNLSGWCGRVNNQKGNMLEIEWDSPTLNSMPPDFIRNSMLEGYEFASYFLEASDVELIHGRSRPAQDPKHAQALKLKYAELLSAESPDEGPQPGQGPSLQKIGAQLLKTLSSITGSGAYAAIGEMPFTHPGLRIEGLGEIGLPINALQARALIDKARQAPFGKGSQTITDTAVRNTWEIDANQVAFDNPDWISDCLDGILTLVKRELGIEEAKVAANLYKLLIYEPGGFFLPHIDSEKEPGMFGTLIIGLPSAHTGGELLIRFEGQEMRTAFGKAASRFTIPFAAFYADCEHEVKPVQSGYRVCLTYNLVQKSKKGTLRSPQFGAQSATIAGLLRQASTQGADAPVVILLGHQYTPANFRLSQLKLNDRPKAEALLAAAKNAGFMAQLGLVTHYQMGQLELDYDPYYRYKNRHRNDYDDQPEDGTMGEVYEEYTAIEHWADDGPLPGLGKIEVPETHIFSDLKIGEDDPIEQEQEGYTGNAGMTIEYWYHYGAVVLWPQSAQKRLLGEMDAEAQLDWLRHYVQHWNPENRAYALLALKSLSEKLRTKEEPPYSRMNYLPAAAALAKLADQDELQSTGATLLDKAFLLIEPNAWIALAEAYDTASIVPMLKKAAVKKDIPRLLRLLQVLEALDQAGHREPAQTLMPNMPVLVRAARLYQFWEPRDPSISYSWNDPKTQEKDAQNLVRSLLALSHYRETDQAWLEAVEQALCASLPRLYVNGVLIPVLQEPAYRGNLLAEALRRRCLEDLQKRVAAKPAPPADWSRPMPSPIRDGALGIIRNFMQSPTESVFHYQAIEAQRAAMEFAIQHANLDLDRETLNRGRPYTLRLTKNQASYERALQEWGEDVGLMEGFF